MSKSNVVIEIRSCPSAVWEFLEDCTSLDDAYERLDELEDEAIRLNWPSDINNYRISWKDEWKTNTISH